MSNNSDYNDFKNWQNGDENDENNPNNQNNPNGFFFMGPMNPQFREMWDKINNGEDFTQSMRDYLNIDDILRQYGKPSTPNNPQKNPSPRRPNKKVKTNTLTQDEYQKLIEIRGYLAIKEQYAHVKALDKLLNQIVMIPIDPKNK